MPQAVPECKKQFIRAITNSVGESLGMSEAGRKNWARFYELCYEIEDLPPEELAVKLAEMKRDVI